MLNERIAIAFCLDDNYVNPAIAVIESIKNSNTNNQFDIYIVFAAISDESKTKLLSCSGKNLEIKFKQTDTTINDVGPKNHVSSAAFMKVELVKLFPDLSKLLYLDGDICVVDDLAPIWQTNIDNKYLAAIENPFFTRHQAIGLKPESLYFNSGIMLLNLEKMRADNFYDEAHKIIETCPEKLMFHDQDVFNMVVDGNFVNLPNVYNFQTFLIRKIHRYSKAKRKEIRQQFKSVVIIHYSSGIKPWKKFDPHPLSSVFKKFYKFPIEGNNNLLTDVKESMRYLYVKLYYFLFLKLGI